MTDLQALKQKRLKWVEANHENDFDEGINRLLTELYPSNAHFIYELLQNAEDPQATEVSFNLTDSAVEFKHNGERLFKLKDVESITSIGNSTKRDDETSIGKFGVGFKAVFAYTNSPEIHSGDFHFRIHDLVVPETKGVSNPAIDYKTTSFIFPFNNPNKSVNIAVTETEKGLRNLGDNTLLFLSHIRTIVYTLPSGETGSLHRIDRDNGRIEIHTLHPGGTETVSHWLHFQKDVEVMDEDGQSKKCNIAIAYSLVEEANKIGRGTTWKIVPLEHGQVSIYFPAEKETSNLRFHLHAPFASTVARDSVRDCSANHQLRDRIAELIVESLISIRDQGLLTVSFLAVLPNSRDNLIKFYQPIQMAIIKAFEEEALTPTKNKSHAKHTDLFRGPAKITGVISDKDLKILTEYADGLWVANPPPQSQREEAFLDALDIYSWGWTELAETFCSIGYDDKLIIEAWLQQKDIKWLISFYALLGEASSSQRKSIIVSNIKIVLVETEDGISYVFPSEAFFPATEGITLPANIKIVNKLTYDSGRSDENKRLAKLFLEKIGVRPFDIKASIEHKLTEYDNQSHLNPAHYLADIKMFVDFWRRAPELNIRVFRNHVFLRGKSKLGQIKWQYAHEFYLDTPYADTGLRNLFNDSSITLEKYKIELLEEYQSIPNFANFAIALGAMSQLEIGQFKATKLQPVVFTKCGRKSPTTIDQDYYLNQIDQGQRWQNKESMYYIGELLLGSKNFSISNAIWKTVCKAEKRQLDAHYFPNQNKQSSEKHSSSLFIKQLKDCAWVPDIQGNFMKPSDLTRDTLHQDFTYNDDNGWLTAVSFGSGQFDRNVADLVQDIFAKENEFESHHQMIKCVEAIKAGFNPEEYLKCHCPIEFPEKPVLNPERRKKNVLELGGNAPSSESVIREKAIKPHKKGATDQAKAYLRLSYTNSEDQLPCQCCRQEMPFRLGADNIHYFEAVQCISGLEAHYKENALALCPTCAAMYKYACTTNDDEIEESILEYDNSNEQGLIIIPIILAGEEHSLYFVEAHWFDLKTILE